ncbi:MAG: NAD-dependent DNA ligase LigA [Patescibacteria group bacterium]
MNAQEAKKRLEKLKKEINHHRYLYHVLDREGISDAALDSLKHELKKLEDAFPQWVTPDSPTQRVSGKPLKEFKKVTHARLMLSLEDAFSLEELQAWFERISKVATIPENFFCEVKFDGLAISLMYEKGILQEASTRGDGRVGEEVTQNIKTIESVPLSLDAKGAFEVRGEVVMTKKVFEEVNRAQEKAGLKTYANPRNLAAGSVRQLDPAITRSRKLEFYAYDLFGDEAPATHAEKHALLKKLGFKTDRFAKKTARVRDVEYFHNAIEERREKLPYHIDGIVVTIHAVSDFEKLGVVGKAPRGAIAYKFALAEATTRVKDIIVQVGRTGVLTPVAILEPVEIGGVTVSRATLHNKEQIKKLGIKIGDTVVVGRAGDVIPEVRAVLPKLRTGHEHSFYFPSECPVCGHEVKEDASGILVRCTNRHCPALRQELLYHFVSKHAFDIDGLGPKIIDALLDNGLIQDAPDLFLLTEGDLVPLERFGEKSAKNLVEAIARAKKITLPRFLVALGILHVGEETAVLLARNFQFLISNSQIKMKDFIKTMRGASREDLEKIADIGPIVAKSIFEWFADERNIARLKKFWSAGVVLTIPAYLKQGKAEPLKDLTFVLTGELESLTREQAKEKIRARGGDISESVSAKTSFVVAGSNQGSKYDDAKKLNIPVLSENEFLKKL